MIILAPVYAHFAGDTGTTSGWTTIAYANVAFGWLIYAIPFAIIGFKIYPEPKKKK